MAQVSITQLQNGTTGDANAVDANFNALATQINGNIDATNIAAGSVGNTQLASAISPITRTKEMFVPFVYSGFTIATSASLSSTIIGGTAYVNGTRVVIANTPITVTASKDTYVDILDTGAVVQVAVANNATSGMTLSLNSDGSNALRIAKLVSSGTAIVQVLQNVPNTAPVSPNTLNWSGADALGNIVYPTGPASAKGLTNPYKCYAYRLNALTPSGTGIVIMDATLYDTGGNFNTTTGKFTAPVAGFYHVTAQLTPSFNGANVANGVAVGKNGTTPILANTHVVMYAGTFSDACLVSGLVQLAAGDTLEIDNIANPGKPLSLGAGNCYLMVYLVSVN